MSPRTRRFLITLLLLVIAAVPLLLFAFGQGLRSAPLELGAGEAIPQGTAPRDLLLATDREGDWDIAVLQSDGTLRNLTADDSGAVDLFASVSFDASVSNFLSNRMDADTMGPTQADLETGEVRTLTVLSAVVQMFQAQIFDWDAAWSPDGETLLWASVRDLNLELYTIPMDSEFALENATRHTNHAARDWFHSWSPDGRLIAFNSDREGNEDIFVLNPDSGDLTRLTQAEQDDIHAAWSMDGAQILFISERVQPVASGALDFYLVNVDGSEERPLGEDEVFAGDAVWSPDGGSVAYMSNEEGTWQIYVMDADGSNVRRVTDGEGNYVFPVWKP